MNIEDLTPKLKTKAMECKTVDEMAALLRSEGIEPSDEEIDSISGGLSWDDLGRSCTSKARDMCPTFC